MIAALELVSTNAPRRLCTVVVVFLLAAITVAVPAPAQTAPGGKAPSAPAVTAPAPKQSGTSIWPAVVAGIASVTVAVLGAVLSYAFGRRTMRQELDNRLKQVQAEGTQDRETAERQYQLDAMKVFRTAVGPPKSQIIEAAHDLSERLRRLFGVEQEWTWTAERGYYRRTFTWLIARPLVWIEILRREMVYLDQTLGDLIEDELRFLAHCRLLERAVIDVDLFDGTGYNRGQASAHVFGGRLRTLTEHCRTEVGEGNSARLVCIDSHAFDRLLDGAGDDAAQAAAEDIERLVTDLANPENRHRPFRVARLIAVYCTTNCLLESFSLPFREAESTRTSTAWVRLLPEEFQPAIARNLDALLATAPPRPAQTPNGGVNT
jgi:hypothetical protein